MQVKSTSTGRFETSNASRYLQQLCKHFAHKVDVTYDETSGEVALPIGPARLRADSDALVVEVEAPDAAGLERAQGVIDSHLVRFAFREEFEKMDWTPAS